MMKLTRTLLKLGLAALLCSWLSVSCWASKADELLSQAQAKIRAAQKATSSADRRENYTDAIEILTKIEHENKFIGTPQGAEASYKIALLNRTLADNTGSIKKKKEHLYAAYETLKRLLNIYDKPVHVLEENLTREEARRVREIVGHAKTVKASVAAKLDKINSADFKYKILDVLVMVTGRIPGFSYWFAIVLITFIVKLLITPLTHAQFKSMKEMQKVAPLIKEIQVKYKGDQKTIGEKTMALYKEHKINPFASCLPLIVQMPILIGLFYTIKSYEFQFAKGTFLWIGSSLSHIASLPVMFQPGQLVFFTARNLSEPDLLLVILYVISMYISTRLSAVDPTQAEQQKMMAIMMPLMFAVFFAGFPSAFLLYWLIFNILQTAQQYYILRAPAASVPLPATAEEPKTSGETRTQRRRKKR